jgi:hypothetical protein
MTTTAAAASIAPDRNATSAAIVGSNLVTVAGVLLFGWDLLFVLMMIMLDLACSAAGLSATVARHHRITGDPAHMEPQFTGWLRMRGERRMPFAESLVLRTAMFPATVFVFILLVQVNRTAAPPSAAVLPVLSMLAVAVLAYGETLPLRRAIGRVPFARLRGLGIAMVHREAATFVFFFAGLVAWQTLGHPLAGVVAAYVLLKTAIEVWLVRRVH